MPYEIRYKIQGLTGDKQHVAGPYDTWALAEEHRLDISSFEGVTECWMFEKPHEEEPCAAEEGAYSR